MNFHEQLARETSADRAFLLTAPVIQRCLSGDVTRELYVAFLTQAYHHVRHTVPLLMAVGSRLPDHHAWLRDSVLHYLEEETGHEQWILNDIAAAGGDREAAAASAPNIATEAMVAYAYDTVMRRNPIGFFGMVHVLEGTSVSLALQAADRIQVDARAADACLHVPAQPRRARQGAHQRSRGHPRAPHGPGRPRGRGALREGHLLALR